MTTPPTCPVHRCPRVRRNDRPLCNMHLRRVGPGVLERWFARARAAKSTPDDPRTTAALVGIGNTLVLNATAYDQIRAQGRKPHWDTPGQRWVDPRERATDILTTWTRRHAFGRDPHNDASVIEQIAAELFPVIDP